MTRPYIVHRNLVSSEINDYFSKLSIYVGKNTLPYSRRVHHNFPFFKPHTYRFSRKET